MKAKIALMVLLTSQTIDLVVCIFVECTLLTNAIKFLKGRSELPWIIMRCQPILSQKNITQNVKK